MPIYLFFSMCGPLKELNSSVGDGDWDFCFPKWWA